MLCGYVSGDGACGDYCVDTKERYVEILEFTHFVAFFNFSKIEENHKETLAQVFTDVRYPKQVNEVMSENLWKAMKNQGF